MLSHQSNELIEASSIRGRGAAALLVTEGGHYLLQLRDDVPGIWFPGFWGLFGGAVEANEEPADALRRELTEELGFSPGELHYFSQVVFDLSSFKDGFRQRYLYEVPIRAADVAEMKLGEGLAMKLFSSNKLLSREMVQRIVPYDAFGLMLHIHRDTLIHCHGLP